ncbi:hypothetical protein [Loktanella salsilacus]|uniref:hypothetical protein n=1 Tax=Loktanella salsilacus TaxID=195913 RepID=UPI003736DDFC
MKSATRKIVTAVTTFSVALSIGFVMQYGDAVAARLGIDEPIGGPDGRTQVSIPASAVTTSNVAVVPPLMAPRATSDTMQTANIPQELVTPTLQMPELTAALDLGAASTMIQPPEMQSPKVTVCNPSMTATALPMAMVQLQLAGDCHKSAPVSIHHQGMIFSAMTDADGKLSVDVPALSRDALFIADFNSGKAAAASVTVPDLDKVDRAVLQWQGDDGVQLHALEFGAGYNDAGHIWSASTGTFDQAQDGQGGFFVSLGDVAVSDTLRAEVYTFPSGTSARDGQVILNVEAEVTSRNCGRDVSAQSIQIGPNNSVGAIDLTMTMPGCDAIGEFLVLKNMFADLTLAAK